MRVLGFVLIGASIILTILAFTFASNYNPQAGLAYNMSRAYLFQQVRTTHTVVDCPQPPYTTNQYSNVVRQFRTANPGCPTNRSEWSPGHTITRTNRRVTGQMPFGVALALTGVVGLAGVGLVAFGGPRS